MKDILVRLGRAIPAASIIFGLMVYVTVTLVTLVAGLFIHFTIAVVIGGYAAGCYLWAFRHDKGFIIRRYREIVRR